MTVGRKTLKKNYLKMENILRWGEACASCGKKPDSSKGSSILLGFNLLMLIISASLALLWIGWWKAMEENDRLNLLEFAFKATGIWFDWTKLFFGLSVATFVYLALFLLLVTFLLHARFMRGESASLKMHLAYVLLHAFVVLCCCAFVGVFAVLFSGGLQLVKLKIIYSAPILHLAVIVVLTAVVGFLMQRLVASFFYKSENGKANGALYISLGLSIALLLISYIIPFTLMEHSDWMPCVRESAPPKPLLLGHKGAIALAPENTKMSFEAAVSHGSAGLESDLQITKDGKFFMMHDNSLKRTTDIVSLYPELANEPMVYLNSSVVESLNAGKWYVEIDPENTVTAANATERDKMTRQRVPSFRDYLTIAKESKQIVIWDFKAMKLNRFILQKTLDVIDEVGIEPQLVWLGAKLPWFPADKVSREYTKNDKAFRWTLFDENRPEIDDLEYHLRYDITNRNIGYGKVFPTSQLLEFSRNNITNNVWVVNSRWMYSLLWCTGGVASVTTNRVDDFDPMTKPIGLMRPSTYGNFVGLTIGLSLFVLMLWIATTASWLCYFGATGSELPNDSLRMNILKKQGSNQSFGT